MTNLTIQRLFGAHGVEPEPLPLQAVKTDSVDEYMFSSYQMDAPRFARTVQEAPVIAPKVEEPPALDFATASADEIAAWQKAAREARRAREEGVPYEFWTHLAKDMFGAYHHAQPPEVRDVSEMDPATRFHSKVMQVIASAEETTETRNYTRDDAPMAALAVMKGVPMLREKLEHELVEQVRQSEQIERHRQKAESAISQLESLREQARDLIAQGEGVPDELRDKIKTAVINKRTEQQQAADLADAAPVPLDVAGYEAIRDVIKAVHDHVSDMAQHGAPGFGQGIGNDEPRYESPEQALQIAERWANDKTLRQIAALYGKFDPHMTFMRARRIEGGQEEIVDVTTGDDLKRTTPGELGLLADPDFEDDFYSRYLTRELVVFSTVGEEHAGRGPVVIVLDGSGSMKTGEPSRNASSRAVCLALLDICRREKRDFAVVEFSSVNQLADWTFPAKKPLDAEQIVDMAAHLFSGSTHPLQGIAKAHEIMTKAPAFRKADIVLVSDGEATFTAEDARVRDHLREMGVRIHGICIGQSRYRYIEQMCEAESIVGIHDLDLGDPNAATSYLASHIT